MHVIHEKGGPTCKTNQLTDLWHLLFWIFNLRIFLQVLKFRILHFVMSLKLLFTFFYLILTVMSLFPLTFHYANDLAIGIRNAKEYQEKKLIKCKIAFLTILNCSVQFTLSLILFVERLVAFKECNDNVMAMQSDVKRCYNFKSTLLAIARYFHCLILAIKKLFAVF